MSGTVGGSYMTRGGAATGRDARRAPANCPPEEPPVRSRPALPLGDLSRESSMSRRRTVPLFLLAATVSLAGCAHGPPPDRVQAVAAVAPPPARHEAAGRAPHPGYVWVAGYWNWVNDRHIWALGYWAVPPNGFRSWDAAHWVRDQRQGWILVRGRWR